MPELRYLLVGDDPAAWAAAGFTVRDDTTSIGTIGIRFVPDADPGVVGWELTDAEDGSIDGLATAATDAPPAERLAHPNGVSHMDHVVVLTPDLSRTVAALEAAGFSARRTREVPGTEPPRGQVFLWAGETILEVVGPLAADGSAEEPARIWGLALTTADLDGAVALLGPNLSTPKPAVQQGRTIATIDTRTLGIGSALAVMTPHPGGPGHGADGSDEPDASGRYDA